MNNHGIGVVDLVYQRTAIYILRCKSSIRIYLHIFVDLMNVAYSHSKISFLTVCLVVTQAEVEHYQRIKLDQKENAGAGMS